MKTYRWTAKEFPKAGSCTDQDYDDLEYVEYLLSEIFSTGAMTHMGMAYSPERFDESGKMTGLTIAVPDDFVIGEWQDTVNEYLRHVDGPDPHTRRSQAYDDATKPYRGSDDGTFDYAGGFVHMILELMIEKAIATGQAVEAKPIK